MAEIRVNDIFDELTEENRKINECLNVLIRFKTFVDLIFDKLKTNLEANVLQMFDDLHQEVEDVFRCNERDFAVNKNHNQTKTQLIEYWCRKQQTTDPNSKTSSETSNQSIDSIKQKPEKSKSLCKKTFKTYKRVEEKDLELDANERYVCTFIGCGKRLKNRDSLRSHLKIHSTKPKPFQCEFDGCGFATHCKSKLKDHINVHKGIKPFGCNYCGKQFSSQRYLKSHINYSHDIADQILVCGLDQCNKQFKTELSLKNHQRFHLMEKRFACEEANCGYRTILPSILKQHWFKVHSKERPFVCQMDGCSKTYKRNDELNKHMLSHSSERNFKCLSDGCHKAFKTAGDLRKHTVLHSDIELACHWPGCEYTTKGRASLRSHYTIHSSERNYLCNWPECDKRFKNKKNLETHLRIHTSDKRFACSWPGCQYRCTDSGNLFKHRRVHIKN